MARPDEDKLNQLLSMAEELKTDLNAMRADFLSHDHGSPYNPLTLRMAQGVTPTGATSTTVTSSSPADMYDP